MNTRAYLAFLESWKKAALDKGIPPESYECSVKVLQDPSGRSRYMFGLILNPNRQKRASSGFSGCHLCRRVVEASENPVQDLTGKYQFTDMVLAINDFPHYIGSSLAIARGTGTDERPMHSTKDLDYLQRDLQQLMAFSDETGLRVIHNTLGAGETVPRHEHWHIMNWVGLYQKAGLKYGLEATDFEEVKGFSGVYSLPNFPFACIVFDRDLGRVQHFLRNLQIRLRSPLLDGSIPHAKCYAEVGLLVIPTKKDVGRLFGSNEVAGHLFVESQAEYDSFDYRSAIEKLSQGLFGKNEINLESFL